LFFYDRKWKLKTIRLSFSFIIWKLIEFLNCIFHGDV